MNCCKKFLITLISALFVVCIFSACETKLNGTYVNDNGIIKQTITFNRDNTIVVSAFGVDIEGEYKIENNKLTVTYSLLGVKTNWDWSFERKGKSIFIDGAEFVKQ